MFLNQKTLKITIMFKFREIKFETEYKLLELNPDTPFTQAWFFGEWQKAMGRKVRRFEIRNNTEIFGFFQAVIYPLVFSNNFIYVPHGPILMRNPNEEFLKKFKKEMMRIVKEENAIFARFDPVEDLNKAVAKGDRLNAKNNSSASTGFDFYFHKTPTYAYRSSYFQPKFEWILDLKKSEEEILNNMHPKTRYNINLARKRGIKVEIINENLNKYFYDFFRLSEETAKRDNFKLHPKFYYQNIFGKCDENKNAFLPVAEYNGKILAINLIFLFGNIAYFMHGGSSGEYKNLMFSYLAHWGGILEAKRRGFKIYNFGAIDGKFSAQGGPASSWEGISRFKKGFGGELLEYADSYDIVLKPCWYYFYNLRKWLLNQK